MILCQCLEKALAKNHSLENRQYFLLAMAKKRMDGPAMDQLIEEVRTRDKRLARLERQRLMIDIGGEYQPRDGKIRFRFEDMPDREKSFISSFFGRGKNWLNGRIQRFNQASMVWQELEKAGPEAVEQVKEWMHQVLDMSDGDYKRAKAYLKNFSEMISADSAGQKRDTGFYRTSTTSGRVFSVSKDIEEKYMKRTASAGVNQGAAKGQLLEEIKKAFGNISDQIDFSAIDDLDIKNKDDIPKEKRKAVKVNSFALEMTMLNAQDIIFGHNGAGQEDFFHYNGKEESDTYNKSILKWAAKVQDSDFVMNQQLSKLDENPALKKEISDKLLKRYLAVDVKKNAEIEKEIKRCGRHIQLHSDNIAAYTLQLSTLSAQTKDFAEILKSGKKLSKKEEEEWNSLNDIIKKTEQDLTHSTSRINHYDQILKEQRAMLYKTDSFDKMATIVDENIRADGIFSDEVCDTVELYEARKKKFCEYGNGEMKTLWNAIVKNDKVFVDLMDPADSIAEKKIAELHKKYATLGLALEKQYEYVGTYYLEDHLGEIFDESTTEGKRHAEELQDKNDEQKITYWTIELNHFQDKYLSKNKAETKSINENFEKARAGLQKSLAKYFYYTSTSSVDMDMKNETKMFKKYWFFNSKNYGVDKLVEKNGSSRYLVSMNHAKSIIKGEVELYLHENMDRLQNASSLASLKNFYSEEMGPRIIANDQETERAFLNYVLQHDYHVLPGKRGMFLGDSPDLTDDEMMNGLANLSAEDQQEIEKRTVNFKEAYRGVMVRNSKEDFRKMIPGLVEEYVQKQNKALEEDVSFTDAHRKAAVERQKAIQAERDKVKIQKGYGRMAYNEKLFGGYLDRLKEFGEKKQTICYEANRSKLNKELKSKGERGDDRLYEAAMEKFIRIDGGEPYPDVLAELFDEYVRLSDGYLEKGDRALEWLAGNNVMDGEVRRLKLISDCVKKANIPAEWTDFVITYAAKFASHEAPLKNDPITRDIDEVIESAKHGIERITELEAMPVTHPALKLAHRDACQKMRAWMFVEEEKSALNYRKFDEMVENQKAYFAYANLAYEALDDVLKNDEYIGKLDDVNRSRYENALHDYFTKRIIDESTAFVNEKKKFDKASYVAAAKKRIADTYARDALVMEKNSVSNEDFENQNVYVGQMTKRDFEKALVMSKHDNLINAYNSLDDDQKQIFVMGLYSSQKDERGSARVIYGQKDEERDAARSQIFAYISGEPVKFEVDYGRAVRAFQSKAKNTHLSADQELFKQAMDFTQMVIQKKEQLRPKDWNRISKENYISTLDGDNFRKEIAKEYKNVKENSDIIRDLEINDKASFFAMLGEFKKSDRQREKDQGKFGSLARYYRQKKEGSGIKTVIERVKKMSETQQDMLLYILQDRSMVDFTSGGKNPETGILAHANSEKRFAVYDRLLTDEGRFNALSEAASPASITNAMKTLLSYQVRDDKELNAFSLKEDDFVANSLHRLEAVDWELLEHACDFVDEIERERNKKVVLAHATDELETAEYKEGTLDYKRQRFYGQNIRDFTSLKQSEYDEKFKEAMLNAYHDDHKEMKVEGDDLMSAFLALEPQEKALFYRCLENRDILDVSQKNLYKNIFGIAERDFVDVKGRDDLINEYLNATANGETIQVNDDTHAKAFKSLCSIQINDDMKFEEMNGDNWVDKNLHVNNQLLVFGRNTMIDWKLFKRALQFVTRAVNERKMAAGDQELYRALGDQSNGEMKFDRRYLRRNLHHTGHRFMRFLGKEGYDTIAPYSGYFGMLAGMTEFVVSKKTANYLHEQANSLYKKVDKEEQYFEPEEEEKKEEEDQKGLFLGNLSGMALNFKEQKEALKQMRGNMRDVYDGINELRGKEKKPTKAELAKERRQARQKADDKLDNAMADLVQKREAALDAKEKAEEDLRITGCKCVDLVLKYGATMGGTIDKLNKYLVEKPQYLEMADTYIEKYMGGFMSAKTLGEYYGKSEEWSENKIKFVSNFFIENAIPDDLEKILQGACNVMETSKEFLSAVSEYTNFGAAVFGDFMNIVGSVSNIKKLNAVKKDAKEKEAGDKEKVEGIDFTKYDKELVEFAQGNNSALMYVAGDLTKQAEGRKILATIGDLGVKGAKLAKKLGAADFSKLIGAAFRTADFFWKCFADNKSVYQYYTREGSGILDKLLSGNARLKNTNVGQKLAKEESREYDKDNKTVVTSKEFRLIRNGQGFERDDEIADYLKLNMVHSLLFSSSKFNPLEQPRLLAECTLTIMGLSDCVGKTDNETALTIFKKLSA